MPAVGQNSLMVGRGRELHVVEQVLARLAAGRPAVMGVTGEPGIGKTRLLDELTRAAGRRGYVVARGRAEEDDHNIPYAAITHALDPLIDALDPRILGALDQEQLAAMFSSLPGRRVAPGSLAGPERRRLFTAVRALLVQLARHRPLVLALDDLQWADGGSVELLSHLLRRPPAGPVLLALAYRPRQVGAALASAIDTTSGAIRLELGPLSAPAASSLLDRLGLSLPPVACADLHTASGGNPCYLLALAPGGGTSPAGTAGTGLPAQVRRTLQREVDALPVVSRDVALLAAVVGDVVRPEIVAAVAQVPAHTVLGALDEMAARDLVRETEVPGAWCFRHPVLRQVVYDSVPPGRRLAAHRRTALVLEACGVPLVERAHHVECAAPRGDEPAVALLAEAARTSLASAPATAVRWYEAALRLVPEREDTSGTHRGLLVAYADALIGTGRLPDVAEVLIRARSLPFAGDPANDACLVAQAGRVYNLHGQHDRAADLLYPALASLPDHGGRKASALTLELAQVAFWRRDYSAMHRFTDQALDGARLMDNAPLLVDAVAQRAFAGYQLGATADALGYLAEAADIADALPDQVFAGRIEVLSHLGHVENVLGHERDALRHVDRALAIARRTGQSYVVPLLRCNRTRSLIHQGRLAEAVAEAETALEGARMSANDMFRTVALLCATWASRDRGDPVAAARYGEQALAAGRDLSALATAVAGLYLAEALYDLGALERALSVLLTAAGGGDLTLLEPPLRPRGYELLARAEADRGQVAAATRYAELAMRCPIVHFPRGRLHAQRARATALCAQGRHSEALTAATAPVEDAQAVQAPVEIGRSRLLLGHVQNAVGDREQAVRTLAQSEADLATTGADRERDPAARELRALGMRRPRRSSPAHRPDGTSRLSTREGQVAGLVAAGRMNRQIATQLAITDNTVETHLKRIFTKLEVSSRAAVAAAIVGSLTVTGKQGPAHGSTSGTECCCHTTA
ncbi:MAG: helix-turn-helix transcriptional regulator [Pseudonocardiaceae bacterium]